MTSKMVGVKLTRGERVRIETPGGGGYGDPMLRNPREVVRDFRLGFVSREAARADYGVVIDCDGEVDEAATTALRRSGLAA